MLAKVEVEIMIRDLLEALIVGTAIIGITAFIIGFCFAMGSNIAWEMFGYL